MYWLQLAMAHWPALPRGGDHPTTPLPPPRAHASTFCTSASQRAFSYFSGVMKSGSAYARQEKAWQARHRLSASHTFLPRHHVCRARAAGPARATQGRREGGRGSKRARGLGAR